MSHEILGTSEYHGSTIICGGVKVTRAQHKPSTCQTLARISYAMSCGVYVRTLPLTCYAMLYAITYLIFQPPGGTYALYCHITRTNGTWEAKQPFAITESFKVESGSIVPFHLLPADVRTGALSCLGVLNAGTNSQPHVIKWAFKEAHQIREHCYGFIFECLVTKRAVLRHSAQAGKPLVSGPCVFYLILYELFEIIELFKPTPMMLVSIKILPSEFRVQSKLPLSTASLTSESTASWTKLSLKFMTAAGHITSGVNNNDPDLTKHAWGLRGLIVSTEHLFAVMEWQHAGLVHIPPPVPVTSGPPPVSV